MLDNLLLTASSTTIQITNMLSIDQAWGRNGLSYDQVILFFFWSSLILNESPSIYTFCKHVPTHLINYANAAFLPGQSCN